MLECRECEEYAVDNVWGFLLVVCANSYTHKFTCISPGAHFHAESTGASITIIVLELTELFRFFQEHSQRECTVDSA